jgi:hypothetical protein
MYISRVLEIFYVVSFYQNVSRQQCDLGSLVQRHRSTYTIFEFNYIQFFSIHKILKITFKLLKLTIMHETVVANFFKTKNNQTNTIETIHLNGASKEMIFFEASTAVIVLISAYFQRDIKNISQNKVFHHRKNKQTTINS